MKQGFPWHLLVYSVVGAIVLRPVITDDGDYMGACLLYAVAIGFISAVLEIKDEK